MVRILPGGISFSTAGFFPGCYVLQALVHPGTCFPSMAPPLQWAPLRQRGFPGARTALHCHPRPQRAWRSAMLAVSILQKHNWVRGQMTEDRSLEFMPESVSTWKRQLRALQREHLSPASLRPTALLEDSSVSTQLR